MKWSLCSTGNRDKPVEYVLERVRDLGLDILTNTPNAMDRLTD
ncbi:MAG: hypothetical protein K0R28_1359 [Paenibacillus sp.]|nr:hypothetical protein [Paenibacillus sp.]